MSDTTKRNRIEELVKVLNKAAAAYYAEDNGVQSEELMSNYEYDQLYDELVALQNKTGYIPEDSPTLSVGTEVVAEGNKETHEMPMKCQCYPLILHTFIFILRYILSIKNLKEMKL